jgi:hypothetical protein
MHGRGLGEREEEQRGTLPSQAPSFFHQHQFASCVLVDLAFPLSPLYTTSWFPNHRHSLSEQHCSLQLLLHQLHSHLS